jgi:single-strand DNA-binding protein
MLNRAIVMGRLTDNPELRKTPNDVSVVSFTLAVDRTYRSGTDRVTDFLDIVAWRSTAEFVSKYFVKGQLVAVEGSIQVRSYTDRDGNKRRAWEIVADQVHFAESKRDSSAPAARSEQPASYSNADPGAFTELPDDDSDLPF